MSTKYLEIYIEMAKIKSLKSDQFVVKSNDLVEARYRLSLQESHVVLWLLTQICNEDEDFKTHQLKVEDFANMAGLRSDAQYDELKKTTLRLMQRVMQIYDPEKNETIQVSWLSLAKYHHKTGYVSLRFDPALKPYLLQLKSHFTKIDIADTMKFKSIYAVRIFELLSQYSSVGKRGFTIDDLRSYCGIKKDEYELYTNLKSRVFNRAKTEINAKTDYEVDYKEIKESRKVVSTDWSIKKKNHFEKFQSEKATILEKELRSTAAILEQLIEYGFTKQAANRFVKNHEESNIVNAIKAVEVYMVKHAVKNPRALLETAIKEKWHPDVYKSRKGGT
jgi:plasmid replication initiation protein